MRRVLINTIAGAFWVPRLVRTAIYRLCGFDVAWDARLTPAITITGTQLTIGQESHINFRSVIDCRAPVIIGSRCGIGMGVQIITGTHDASNPRVRAGRLILEPITIQDGCWIGSGAILLPGVTIGEGCIVAAGSVVTRDCTPHGLYAGAPAVRKRDLSGLEEGPQTDERLAAGG